MLWRTRLVTLGLLAALSACTQPPAAPPTDGGYRVQLFELPQVTWPLVLPQSASVVEDAIVTYLNGKRARRHVPIFSTTDLHQRVARAHAWVAAVNGQAYLTTPDGKTLLDRLKAEGQNPSFWAGYAWGPVTASDPYRNAIDAMAHLEDRLLYSPDFHRVGVGVYRRGNQLFTAVVLTD